MRIPLDFEECIKDSPNFRESLHLAEAEMVNLENQLDRMTKTCSAMIDSGKSFTNVTRVFISSLDDFSRFNKDDAFCQNKLKQFSATLSDIANFQETFFEHAQVTVKKPLIKFLKEDVKAVRDMKKVFDKSSDEYSNCLSKHASVNKMKPVEVEDATSNLANARQHFRTTSMDYVVQINMMQKKNRTQIVEKLLSFMHGLSTFFHQGYDLLKEFQPFLKNLIIQLDDFNQSAQKEYSVMTSEQGRYMRMTGDSGLHMRHVDGRLVIEGHLFKRASNAFKSWHRRWFTIKENKLFYQKKNDDVTAVIDDVRLLTVRAADDAERRFCFEVISPGKSFLLQADSDEAKEAWISAFQSSIGEAFKQTMITQLPQATTSLVNKVGATLSRTSSSSSLPCSDLESVEGGEQKQVSFLENGSNATISAIYQVPGNRFCADCGRTDPRWASISLGVTLCIDCSGVHRSLGVHISKVRSLTLDQWEPEVIKIMYALGNKKVNEIFQANLPKESAIRSNCSQKERQIFIKAKYVDKKFALSLVDIAKSSTGASGQKLTRWSVSRRALNTKKPNIQARLESSEDTTSRHSKVYERNSDDVLIFGRSRNDDATVASDDLIDMDNLGPDSLFFKASEAGNLPVMMLASSNGAFPNSSNPNEGSKTPLMAAATVGSIQACEFLLLNGAHINDKDKKLRTALHYAALHNHTGITCQLLKRKVDLDAIDDEGRSALQIAIDEANADIVTLIRLKKMSNQMKEDDVTAYQQNDDLVNDVFRDFTQRATSSLPSLEMHSFDLLGATQRIGNQNEQSLSDVYPLEINKNKSQAVTLTNFSDTSESNA